jgi:hypothetical protein
MIKVKGTSYRTIDIPELGDRVYFGQEKIFSDAQYASAPSLKKSIETGNLFLIEHSPEVSSGFIAPVMQVVPVTTPVPAIVIVDPPKDQSFDAIIQVVSDLKDHIVSLTDKVNTAEASKSTTSDQVLQDLTAKMASIEDKLTSSPDLSKTIKDSFSTLQKQVNGLVASGPNLTQRILDNSPQGEIYVPSSIKVDDMANNVKLETKNLGQGNAMNQALANLKALNANKTPK